MMIREPMVAGRFYPGDRAHCERDARALLAPSDRGIAFPGYLHGGLVPHAGWLFSGRVAGETISVLAATRRPKVLVLFGGVHRFRGRQAALFPSGRWETPLGTVDVDGRLTERILSHTNLIAVDAYAHEEEHSLEVQIPLLQCAFPKVPIVPIMVPPIAQAHEVGEAIARTLDIYHYDAVIVGTTDLTHYGPQYGFTPHGEGAEANRWAKEVNDRRFIDLVLEMKSTEVVAEANRNRNACNAGAVAATLRACMALGASHGILLRHTTSGESAASAPGGENSVGYAGIVFGG